MLKRNRKKSTTHHHPVSPKQKREQLMEKKKAKAYRQYLMKIDVEKQGIITNSEQLKKKEN